MRRLRAAGWVLALALLCVAFAPSGVWGANKTEACFEVWGDGVKDEDYTKITYGRGFVVLEGSEEGTLGPLEGNLGMSFFF
jgi:hypothetical protein